MSDIVVKNGLHKSSALSHLAKGIFLANEENENPLLMDIGQRDVLNFLQELDINEVKYLLVGGMATTFHGHIRTTQHLDLWIEGSPDNKRRLVEALKNSGVAGAEHFLNVPMIAGWSTVSLGDNGFVVDFISDLKSFSSKDFDACYRRAKEGVFEGVPIKVIHLNDLILEKKETARPKDLEDVEQLERIRTGRMNK